VNLEDGDDTARLNSSVAAPYAVRRIVNTEFGIVNTQFGS
jgi:hypothetical protein